MDDNGPFYIQLGYAATLGDIRYVIDNLLHLLHFRNIDVFRNLFEKRLGVVGKKVLRIEKVRFTGREGVTSEGCPIAKWVS